MTSPVAVTDVARPSLGRRTLGIGLAASVLAAGAYAYTAANTVPATMAGDGSGAITGYTISNVQYDLAADPQEIAGVSFDLNATASQVKAKLGTDWESCTGAGTAWTCAFTTDVPVVDAASLAVVATS